MKLQKFSIEYRHEGHTYLLELPARDFEDAAARIRSAYHNGEVLKRVGGIG